MNVEFVEALNELCKTRRIKKEVLLEAIEQALMSAYKKNFDSASNARVTLDAITGEVAVYAQKKVVEQVENPQLEIAADNPAVDNKYQLGDIVEVEVTPRNFGRIAAQAAKQVIVQRIREAERGVIYDEYIEKEAEILTAIVLRVEGKTVYVDLNRTEGVLEPSQQMPEEEFHVGDRIKVYVMEVSRSQKGPQVMVSRTHSGLVKRLFEMRMSSAMVEGFVSSSIWRTNRVPNSGMPSVPVLTPRIWLGARSSGSGEEKRPRTFLSLSGRSTAWMPVSRSSMLIMVGSSWPRTSSLTRMSCRDPKSKCVVMMPEPLSSAGCWMGENW